MAAKYGIEIGASNTKHFTANTKPELLTKLKRFNRSASCSIVTTSDNCEIFCDTVGRAIEITKLSIELDGEAQK